MQIGPWARGSTIQTTKWNVSLLVKLVKLYLDHSRLWKSQESLKIVNLMIPTLPQAAPRSFYTSSTRTFTQLAWVHFPRADELDSQKHK